MNYSDYTSYILGVYEPETKERVRIYSKAKRARAKARRAYHAYKPASIAFQANYTRRYGPEPVTREIPF